MLEYPKKIVHWYGTDALKLIMYPPGPKLWHVRIFLHRIFWKVMWRFFDIHYVNSLKLSPYLEEFGISKDRIKLKEVPYSMTVYKKKPHKEFTVLFYLPKAKNPRFKDWIYGRSYYECLKERVNILVVDGTYNMGEVYPIVDAYIKINAHRGSDMNRIGKECIVNDIPVLILNTYEGSPLWRVINWINIRRDIFNTNNEKKVKSYS